MTVEVRTVLDDRYQLDELIAHGGMADVYRGTDRLLERPVAVKVLREVDGEVERERFVAEARTLASLNHPGLITLLDAGIRNDRPYLVLELATGPTLARCIQEGRFDADRVRRIGLQLAEALAYAHLQGVVHRDVKPSNVLLSENDRILLADFGIAQLVGTTEHHTRTGETIGSPAYLAPEQVSAEPVTPAADIFSLGLVLLEALTGVRAYAGAPIEAAAARLHAAPTIPSYVPATLRGLIARMTHRDPAQRPTAEEVALELGSADPVSDGVDVDAVDLATDEIPLMADRTPTTGVSVVESPGDEPAARARRGRRTVAAALVILVVALGTFLVLGTHGKGTASGPSPTVPTGVPTRLQQPLTDLHDAVEGQHR